MFAFVLEMARRIQYFFGRSRFDSELREEMDTHLAMIARESDPATARQRLGNATRWREMSRATWGWNWLESLARDVVYGLRLLAKSPAFTLTASLSLAIGMGATLGIFSLMNALLFKTLPIPEPQQLWELGHNTPAERDDNFSYRMFDALQKANSSGIPLFALGGDNVQVNYGDSTRNTPVLIISGDAFRILKLNAHLGRLLNSRRRYTRPAAWGKLRFELPACGNLNFTEIRPRSESTCPSARNPSPSSESRLRVSSASLSERIRI